MIRKTRTTIIALAATAVLAVSGGVSVASAATTGTTGGTSRTAEEPAPTTSQPSTSRVINCTSEANGVCFRNTCTAGVVSHQDCSSFARSCLIHGHKYEGDSESGTCVRQVYA